MGVGSADVLLALHFSCLETAAASTAIEVLHNRSILYAFAAAWGGSGA
jgi:hypothetical protein